MKHESKTSLTTHIKAGFPRASSTVLLCLLSAQAFAQTAPTNTSQQAEEIVVTGSRIRGVAPVGSSVVSVGRDDIEASGAVATAQMLQQIPQVFNLGVSESSRGQSGGAGNITYGSSVNLRGIGPFATLALVNGHRAVSQGTTGAAIDPSIIPTLALERVEIVADGASAIYGSDAVAGVVNMILRRNVEGGQAFVRFGTADNYRERQVGALWGHKWNGGQVTLTFENSYHTALSGQDRDFYKGDLTAQGGGDFRATQCNPANITIAGVNYAIPATGVTAATAGQLVANTTNKCDNLKYADLIPRQNRNSIAMTFNQDVGHGISFYADGFVTRRDYRFKPQMLAQTVTVPNTNPFYVRPVGAPAGTSESVAYSFVNDLPQNTSNGFSRSAELTVGADVALPGDWKVGALYTFAKNDDFSLTLRGLNGAAITAALADTNPATALNVFSSGANNPATLAAISNNVAYTPGKTTFKNYQIKADGPLAQLPGGKLRTAFGFERQYVQTIGGQTTGPANNPTGGRVPVSRAINSFYTEFLVPIVGPGNAIPGVQKLDLDIAGRVDNYNDVGSTRNPKFGLNWTPVKGITVHTSYGRSFRAPGLTQSTSFTNGGRGGLFVQNYSDPTLGGAQRVGVAFSGSNPDLTPETATTKSIGIDFEPSFGNQTKLSLNYFDIVYANQVTGYLSDTTILNREAQFAGTGVIVRNPSAADVAALIAKYPLSSGVLPATVTLIVDGRSKNLGKTVAQGVDFQASTRIPTDSWGNFGIGLNGTLFTKYQVAIAPAAPLVGQNNIIFNPLRFKARVSGSWSYGPFYSNLFVNYQNGYTNNLATPVQEVSSYTTVDARVSYALDEDNKSLWFKDTTLAFGLINAFDRKPPFVNIAQSQNGGGGFDPTLTNPVGRILSVSLDKRF